MQKRKASINDDNDRANNIYGVFRDLIKWVGITITAYITYKIISSVSNATIKQAEFLAGKETHANIATTSSYHVNGEVSGNILSNLVNLNIGENYHWLLHLVCCAVILMLYFAYKIQKRTNEKFIETYSPQEVEREKRFDPKRLSSGLTKQGNTPK